MESAFRDLPGGAMRRLPYVDNEWFAAVKPVGSL
jgi:hypothetical protein